MNRESYCYKYGVKFSLPCDVFIKKTNKNKYFLLLEVSSSQSSEWNTVIRCDTMYSAGNLLNLKMEAVGSFATLLCSCVVIVSPHNIALFILQLL
jgi:hypothetical protein